MKTKQKVKKWTLKQIAGHIKANVKNYGAAVVVAAFYKKLYKKFPVIGLSGTQAEFAETIVAKLPENIDTGEQVTREPKTVEEAISNKILFIGYQIPSGLFSDKRSKFVVLGTPQEFIDETSPSIGK
jgi:hypothetical protein